MAAEARSRGPLQRAPAQLCGPRRRWQPHPHRWRLEHGLWSQTRESCAGQVLACRPAGQLQGHWSLLRHGSPPPQDLWQSHVPCGSHLRRTCTNAMLGHHKQNHLSTQPRCPRSGWPSQPRRFWRLYLLPADQRQDHPRLPQSLRPFLPLLLGSPCLVHPSPTHPLLRVELCPSK